MVEYVTGLEQQAGPEDEASSSTMVKSVATQGEEMSEPTDPEYWEKIERVRCMRLRADPSVAHTDENPDEDEEVLWEIAKRIDLEENKRVSSVVEVTDPPETH